MVKRLLTLVVLMLAIAGMQAQTLQFVPNRTLKHSIQHAPRKAASLEGTIAWGLGGDSQWGSLGLGSGVVGVKFSVAIYVPGNSLLKCAVTGPDLASSKSLRTTPVLLASWPRRIFPLVASFHI